LTIRLAPSLRPNKTVAGVNRGRKGVYCVARLQAKHGDARLTDLRTFLVLQL